MELKGYAVSIRGKDHVSTGLPLQDASGMRHLAPGWVAAVVADGVGSAKRSDEGSRVAAEGFLAAAQRLLDPQQPMHTVRQAFAEAYRDVLAYAKQHGCPMTELDTTMHAAIFNGRRAWIGHAGDGGVFAFSQIGTFSEVTRPQKGPDHVCVIPFTHGPEGWEFFEADEVRAVMMVTDGIRDNAVKPYALTISGYEAYPAVATALMDPAALPFHTASEAEVGEGVRQLIEKCDPNQFYPRLLGAIAAHVGDAALAQQLTVAIARSNFPLKLLRGVEDDISVAVVAETEALPVPLDAQAFVEPDWKQIHERLYQLLYHGERPEPQPQPVVAARSEPGSTLAPREPVPANSPPAPMHATAQRAPEPMDGCVTTDWRTIAQCKWHDQWMTPHRHPDIRRKLTRSRAAATMQR